MTPASQQSVEFAVSPAVLYELYMDSKKRSQATGAPAKLSRRSGGALTAFGGQLKGKNLLLLTNKMIVQTWRASQWKKSDPDSILVIQFSKTKTGARVDLVHSGVPEYDHQGVTEGWEQYYWQPWRDHLAAEWKAERRRKRKRWGATRPPCQCSKNGQAGASDELRVRRIGGTFTADRLRNM